MVEYKEIKQVQVTKYLEWSENEDEAVDPLEVEIEDEDFISVHDAEEAEVEVITVNEDDEREEEEVEESPKRARGLQRELHNMRCE